jgi:molybdopterin/thiamine biosynthesis adenylyltransferase
MAAASTSTSHLVDAELDRYARQIVLPDVGGVGQRKLGVAQIVIVGAGGIGSPAVQYLAAAGVGRLKLIDDDRVDLSNLQRQILFTDADLGEPKAQAAARKAASFNPHVRAEARTERIDASNAASLIGDADAVLDGSDNFETRLAVADAALHARIPLVSASVVGFEGQLATYRGWEAGKPCYRCLVGQDPALPERSCAEQGVLGALAGVMGSLAAMEAMRAIIGFGDDVAGRLLLVDGLALRFRTVALPKDPGCPACG